MRERTTMMLGSAGELMLLPAESIPLCIGLNVLRQDAG